MRNGGSKEPNDIKVSGGGKKPDTSPSRTADTAPAAEAPAERPPLVIPRSPAYPAELGDDCFGGIQRFLHLSDDQGKLSNPTRLMPSPSFFPSSKALSGLATSLKFSQLTTCRALYPAPSLIQAALFPGYAQQQSASHVQFYSANEIAKYSKQNSSNKKAEMEEISQIRRNYSSNRDVYKTLYGLASLLFICNLGRIKSVFPLKHFGGFWLGLWTTPAIFNGISKDNYLEDTGYYTSYLKKAKSVRMMSQNPLVDNAQKVIGEKYAMPSSGACYGFLVYFFLHKVTKLTYPQSMIDLPDSPPHSKQNLRALESFSSIQSYQQEPVYLQRSWGIFRSEQHTEKRSHLSIVDWLSGSLGLRSISLKEKMQDIQPNELRYVSVHLPNTFQYHCLGIVCHIVNNKKVYTLYDPTTLEADFDQLDDAINTLNAWLDHIYGGCDLVDITDLQLTPPALSVSNP